MYFEPGILPGCVKEEIKDKDFGYGIAQEDELSYSLDRIETAANKFNIV